MAEAKITLTLKPEEYRFLRAHLELALVHANARLGGGSPESSSSIEDIQEARAEGMKLKTLLGQI